MLTAAIKRLPKWAKAALGPPEREAPPRRTKQQTRVLLRIFGGWELRFYYRRRPRDVRHDSLPPRCFLSRGKEIKCVPENVFRVLREQGAIRQVESRPNYSVWGVPVKKRWRPLAKEK